MKRQRLSLYFAISCFFLLTACSYVEQRDGNMLPYVAEILSDSSSDEYLLLSGFNEPSSRGNIVIMDRSDRAEAFADYFVASDIYDNINGNEGGDLLPDYAGERIVEISDNGNTPYSEFLDDRTAMREATVKTVLATLDSAASAKIAVLPSPFMAAYGMNDVDTLLYASDCALQVVSPLRLLAASSQNAGMIAVFADSEAAGTDIYSEIFGEGRVFVYDCDSLPTLEAFFDEYGMQEDHRAIDLMVIDNVNVDVQALEKELATFFSVENFDNLAIRQMTGSDFSFADTKDVAAREVYRLMRKGNLFTHAISYPVKLGLRTDFIGDYSLYNVQD